MESYPLSNALGYLAIALGFFVVIWTVLFILGRLLFAKRASRFQLAILGFAGAIIFFVIFWLIL